MRGESYAISSNACVIEQKSMARMLPSWGSRAASLNFITGIGKFPTRSLQSKPLISAKSPSGYNARAHKTRTLPTTSNQQIASRGIRINKCFTEFASRRESDEFITEERVKINGTVAAPGARVNPGDEVTLDGKIVDWERLTVQPSSKTFHYVKHWKREHVLCTTDQSSGNSIVQEVQLPNISDRMFPVGRLDECSTGLILLTSDGRLPNAVLGASKQWTKKYLVTTDRWVSDDDLSSVRKGVVINTVSKRDRGVRIKRSAATAPCEVERQEDDLLITLHEGRNRQIRKMFGALGYTVEVLHRLEFMGITLAGLDGPGDSCELDEKEMNLVKIALGEAKEQQKV